MSYIVTATVRTSLDENSGGNAEAVKARVLSKGAYEITFDVPGVFSKQKEITLALCETLINAGFVSFEIGHSY